jgi:hypothetical protein
MAYMLSILDANRRDRHQCPGRHVGTGWARGAWRPSLPDEADNHLIELGVAARADAIVTRNLRDLTGGELKFPTLQILTPEQCLERFPCPP